MPATFESLGIKFLYPDNWTLTERAAEEGISGATFELPTGGFFSIERTTESIPAEQVMDEIESSISAEYGEVEREPAEVSYGFADEQSVDFRFYYLDLIIVSRLMMVRIDPHRFVIQIQAESRDFEANERVFEAIMKQIQPQ